MAIEHPIIAICASASTYTKVIPFSEDIAAKDFKVILPATAKKMKKNGIANTEVVIDWANNPKGYEYKSQLIRGHFDEISNCDALLVLNYEKNGKPNYIGGNVLMEMTIGFYLHKPIFIYNDAPTYSPLLDEILGMQPVFLGGDINNLQIEYDKFIKRNEVEK